MSESGKIFRNRKAEDVLSEVNAVLHDENTQEHKTERL